MNIYTNLKIQDTIHKLQLSQLFNCLNLYHVQNNNYNNNYLFIIFICLQSFLQATLGRYSSYTTIRCFAHNLFVNNTLIRQIFTPNHNFTQDCFNYFSLASALSCPFIIQQDHPNKRSRNERFLFSLLENSIPTALLFLYSRTYHSPHAYCCWFRCSMHLLMFICVHIVVSFCCVWFTSFSHAHTDVIVRLFTNSSMYVRVSVVFILLFSCDRYEVGSRNYVLSR